MAPAGDSWTCAAPDRGLAELALKQRSAWALASVGTASTAAWQVRDRSVSPRTPPARRRATSAGGLEHLAGVARLAAEPKDPCEDRRRAR